MFDVCCDCRCAYLARGRRGLAAVFSVWHRTEQFGNLVNSEFGEIPRSKHFAPLLSLEHGTEWNRTGSKLEPGHLPCRACPPLAKNNCPSARGPALRSMFPRSHCPAPRPPRLRSPARPAQSDPRSPLQLRHEPRLARTALLRMSSSSSPPLHHAAPLCFCLDTPVPDQAAPGQARPDSGPDQPTDPGFRTREHMSTRRCPIPHLLPVLQRCMRRVSRPQHVLPRPRLATATLRVP